MPDGTITTLGQVALTGADIPIIENDDTGIAMTEITDWLRARVGGFAQLARAELDAISDFTLLWGLFESRILNNSYAKCVATPGQGADNPCKRGFGGMHTGGVSFAIADGSVRFISYSVDINRLAAMATIAGNESA